jgi:patatin-like phospholipase/acyl hydrolase
MTAYRILSLDGGGMLGLATAVILERLDAAVPGWRARADLFAGTSTGGIIALGLADGRQPFEIRSLYTRKGRQIFGDSIIDDIFDLGKLVGADYDNKYLEGELRDSFGWKRLRDLNRKVLIPAFDLDNEHPDPERRSWAPKFFHNFEGEDSDGDMLVSQVALYTSAAPTYFPSVDGYIDGGVVANSPALAALTQTLDPRAEIPNRPALSHIRLLSLGTALPLYRIKGSRLDWGVTQWAKPLIHIMLYGAMGVVDYQCRQLLGTRYCRATPVMAPDRIIERDAVDQMDEIIELGEKLDLKPVVDWLEREWLPE